MTVLDILLKYRLGLLSGLLVTLKLCSIIWASGLVLGSLLGYCGKRWRSGVGYLSRTISFVLSGVPVLVFLFWLHYPMQEMLGVVINPFFTAAVALSVINIFAVADLVRAGLSDFPNQYVLAAEVCGIPRGKVFRYIQFPILLRQTLPSLLFLQVSMLQATLFASLISVEEIFRIAQRINAEVYRPVQVYSSLAVFFLLICLPLNGLALGLKRRYTRDLSER